MVQVHVRRAFIAALGLFVLSAGAACAPIARGERSSVPSPRGTAVALMAGGKGTLLVVADLESGRVRSRHKLRSLALSAAADKTSRKVLTAQCGGVGDEADDVCGVFSLDTRRVGYIKLQVPNPLSVTYGADSAWLVHGFEQPEGLVVSSANIVDRSSSMTHTPPGTSFVLATENEAFALAPEADHGSVRTFIVPLSTPRPQEPVSVPLVLTSGAVDGEQLIATGMHRVGNDSSDAWIVRFTKSGRVVKEREMVGFDGPMTDVEILGSTIAVVENDNADPEHTTGRIWYFDRDTLESQGSADLGGAPVALTTCNGYFVAANGKTRELLVFEPRAKTPSKRIKLGVDGFIAADVVAFE